MRPLTDEQWARLAPCLPHNAGKEGRPFADHRRIIDGIIHPVPHRDPEERSAPRGVR
ncbi:transposase [Streptomyces sp. NPDC046197]|uniref:transposase n=1 Tax=Streptomyces sp. NPDC046197 TaxID=3154337 RepID=UPI0033DBF78A